VDSGVVLVLVLVSAVPLLLPVVVLRMLRV
jgi:hypothetical protein